MLGAEGFDPAKDIEAITVNRWPHGYASYVNQLSGASYDDDELPYVVGRKRFGRIVIANSDAGGMPLVQVAIDQAHRACEELKG
jgi:spermidine dehydrogenase